MTEGSDRSEPSWRVAVVGSGPSGMYAAASLLAADPSVEVDVFDRLPAPYGLVRYGVAPDHQKIKNVSRVFDRTLLDERVRLLGNVEVGRDITHQELKSAYHQIVYAVGAQGDRRLGIPGEDLDGSWSSTEFVNWYNGHPDRAEDEYSFDGCSEVAVIGIGNVAMDVARILVSSPHLLAKTDISDSALETLRRSPVRTVHLLARRGPVQAKCSPPELKELGELEGAAVRVDARDLDLDPASAKALPDDKASVKNLDILRGFADQGPVDAQDRQVHLHFCTSPTALVGEEGVVVGLRFARNELVPGEGG
ncbi:MAG: FAD-dependent oxidoreductase, partial [Thermoanaerobaculia bacterium]|nr:FAD-dependent oxidoreductase [Thermoanaerobaculia bacterium]